MLVIRGLLLVVGGFAFVFMPGMLLPLLLRRQPEIKRSFIWWGAGVFLVALFPTFLVSSLVRQILQPGDDPLTMALLALISSLVSGLFVEGAQYLLLRWRKPPSGMLAATGMVAGLGAGIVTQVFAGFVQIGAGFRLLFGDTSAPQLTTLATIPLGLLSVQLVAGLVSRAVVFIISGGLGYLVGQSVAGRHRALLMAILLYAAFNLMLQLLQLGLAEQEALLNGTAILIQGIVGGLTLRWLLKVPTGESEEEGKTAWKKRR